MLPESAFQFMLKIILIRNLLAFKVNIIIVLLKTLLRPSFFKYHTSSVNFAGAADFRFQERSLNKLF